ncbi:MAG: transglycosylase domain-containing protein [Deltaproteobacteria bacterium]|nr:transglycosylase domain-containing protein [Deltaproteobacteria bacterium]
MDINLEKIKQIAKWGAGGVAVLLLGVVAGFFIWAPGVVKQFDEVVAQASNNTLILDNQDNLVTAVEGIEDRHSVPISRISPYIQKAVVAAEDRRFFAHRGMDPVRLLGALWADIQSMALKQGGSTITQQLIKLSLLSSERTFTRKIKELFMALAIERAYPKLQVLEFYLNRVYLGHGLYGVEKASQGYFNKSAWELDLNEAAFLAALVKKPEGYFNVPEARERYDEPRIPLRYLKDLMSRHRYILVSMLELGWISKEEYKKAVTTPLVAYRPRPEASIAAYFVQEVLNTLKDELGLQRISGRGLRVYTTLDIRQQKVAEHLISRVRDNEHDTTQASLVALNPTNGYVTAMVGGVDYIESQFNRATRALRQPGSAFKPILYATALENGFSTNSVFLDEPVRYVSDSQTGRMIRIFEGDMELELQLAAETGLDFTKPINPPPAEEQQGDGGPAEEKLRYSEYTPRNYDERYGAGPSRIPGHPPADRRITLSRALELSSNVVAVQLLDRLGMDTLNRVARSWNVPIRQGAGLCAALGCSEVTLLSLTGAYAAFPNGGYLSEPVFIRRVTDAEGNLLYEHTPRVPVEVISDWTAFRMRQLLSDVISRGTGWRARLTRPAGGKTGTNDGPRDTWFIGFTPTLVSGVWLGKDDNDLMPGEAGGKTTARIWRDFMNNSLPDYAGENFPEPEEDYMAVSICNLDGRPEWEDCPHSSIHYFKRGEMDSGQISRKGLTPLYKEKQEPPPPAESRPETVFTGVPTTGLDGTQPVPPSNTTKTGPRVPLKSNELPGFSYEGKKPGM